MKELPLLLSTPMVQAYLALRKTATRRTPNCMNSLVDGKRVSGKKWKELELDVTRYKISYELGANEGNGFAIWSKTLERHMLITPIYQPGDWLYFRENWFPGAINGNKIMVCFDKEDPKQSIEIVTDDPAPYWKKMERARMIPSIHLPIEATRLWAEVTTCTCERVQDITEEQAIAEGVARHEVKPGLFYCRDYMSDNMHYYFPEAKLSFKSLWRSINGLESWTANPPVYAINYKILSTTGKPLEKEKQNG